MRYFANAKDSCAFKYEQKHNFTFGGGWTTEDTLLPCLQSEFVLAVQH